MVFGDCRDDGTQSLIDRLRGRENFCHVRIEHDDQGRAALVYTVSDAMVKKVKSEVRFSYDPPSGLNWEQEKGEAKWLTGSWEFEELGKGRTRATYALRTDPGRVLGLLLRGPVEGKVKELLTKSAAEGLKGEAEAG